MPLRWTLVIAEMGWAVTSAAAKIVFRGDGRAATLLVIRVSLPVG